MRRISLSFLITLSFLLVENALGQLPDLARIPNLSSEDSTNIIFLVQNGVQVKKHNVIAWFPKDSLTEDQMSKIVDTIYNGIKAAEDFITAPMAWQVQQKNKPYIFFFRFDKFVSHASEAGFVSIPFWRIKTGKAPWLHETLHEMLNTKSGNWFENTISEKEQMEKMPNWLIEGLPDYISIKVSQQRRLPRFDVFSNSNSLNIDSLCKQDFNGEKFNYIISFIGRAGMMPELWTKERPMYAPAFYHASCSFIKYIADTYGLKVLLKSISSFRHEIEVLEKGTGHSMEELKTAWLKKLSG